MSRTLLPALAGLLALSTAVAGCTEEGLTGVEGEAPPGRAADAVSATIPVDQLPLWRDTTFTGFATVQDVPFLVVADQPPLRSRALMTFRDVPDSIGGLPVDSIGRMVLELVADTARSSFAEDSATLEVFSLSRDFDQIEATWERAAEGMPWDSGGGDLETRLADLRFQVRQDGDSLASDTLEVPFSGDLDSLVSAWSDAGAVPPLAVRVTGDGTRLVIRQTTLELDAKSAELDSLETIRGFQRTSTFIFDPDLPDAGRDLRIAGLPASRFYFVFRPPDSVQGVPIRGARVNRAELIFHPVSETGSPFRPPLILSTVATELLADPFRFGPRTPIGGTVGQRRVIPLRPDSLATGRPLRIRVSGLLQRWADAPPDSIDQFRVGMRAVPDGQELGFWDFGSEEAADGVKPELRLLFTPPTDFSLP